MSIKDIWLKIKNLRKTDDLLIAGIIVLVAFGSFGLGRLSNILEEETSSIDIVNLGASAVQSIEYAADIDAREDTIETQGENTAPVGDGFVVGSRNSNKYHLPWCSGAQRIKDENKVVFQTQEDAKAAGYVPAGNCKGI